MKDQIERAAMDALRFLPAEDKVNLYLKTVTSVATDDSGSGSGDIMQLTAAVASLQSTVDALAKQVNASGGPKVTP